MVEARLHGGAIELPLRQTGAHWGLMSLAALLMLEALGRLDDGAGGAGRLRAAGGPRRGARDAAGRRRLHPGRRELQRQPGLGDRGAAHARRAAGQGRRIVALTDMLELGAESPALHAALAAPIEDAARRPGLLRRADDAVAVRGRFRQLAAAGTRKPPRRSRPGSSRP